MAQAFNLTASLNIQANNASIQKVKSDIEKTLNRINYRVDVSQIRKVKDEVDKLNESQKRGTKEASAFQRAIRLRTQDYLAYAAITAAVAKLTSTLAIATREAIKFESELAKIAQVTNKSNAEIKGYSNQIIGISKKFGVAQTEVARLTRTLAQAGFSFNDALKGAERLSKTSLLATFSDLDSTTESLIATTSAFGLSIDDAADSLEAINSVTKRYAVEADDIVDAIKRTGGAFASAGGQINELIALFTSVRSFSRESAETIATGFRTIFGRLQRPRTLEYFKQLGIELETADGKFVGAYKAIQLISEGLKRAGIAAGDIRFAQVVEQLGGIRQISRVIPLITNFKNAQEALDIANKGVVESDADVIKAKETLAFKLRELEIRFKAVITEFTNTQGFKLLADIFLKGADAAIQFAEGINKLVDSFAPLLPILAVVGGFKLGKFLGGAFKGVSTVTGKHNGGMIQAFARGGYVPGVGNRDTVPAMLTPGEFVIRKSSVNKIGPETLAAMNQNGYAGGGPVSGERAFYGALSASGRPTREFKDFIKNSGAVEPAGSIEKSFNALDTEKKQELINDFNKSSPSSDDKNALQTAYLQDGIVTGLFMQRGEDRSEEITKKIVRNKGESFGSTAFDSVGQVKANIKANLLDTRANKIMTDSIKNSLEESMAFSAESIMAQLDIAPLIDFDEKEAAKKARQSIRTIDTDSIQGFLFEALISTATGAKLNEKGATFDFSSPDKETSGRLAQLFGTDIQGRYLEAKRTFGTDSLTGATNSIGNKILTAIKTGKLKKDDFVFKAAGGEILTSDLRKTSSQGVKTLIKNIRSTPNWQSKDGLSLDYNVIPVDVNKIRSKNQSLLSLVEKYKNQNLSENERGFLFEKIVARKYGLKLNRNNEFLDFPNGEAKSDKKFTPELKGAAYKTILTKTLNQRFGGLRRSFTPKTDHIKAQKRPLSLYLDAQKFAGGGDVEGSDTVPAMLTPGEYVINKKAAKKIGYSNLNKMNKQGVVGYAKGGAVGVQKFAEGGGVLSGIGDISTLYFEFALLVPLFQKLTGVAETLKAKKEEEAEKNKALNESIEEAKKGLNGFADELVNLESELVRSVGQIGGTKGTGRDKKYFGAVGAAEKAGDLTIAENSGSKPKPSGKFAGYAEDAKLQAQINKVTEAYKGQTEELSALNKIKESYSGSLLATKNAVVAFHESMKKGREANVQQYDVIKESIKTTEEKIEAEKAAIEALEAQAGGGRGGRLLDKARDFVKDNKNAIAGGAVALGATLLASNFEAAAKSADEFAQQAIGAGNASEAYNQTIQKVSNEQKASAGKQGAIAGAAALSIFGPLGIAVGGVIGGIIGFTGVLTKVTDLLGISNSEEEKRVAAEAAASQANVNNLNKMTEQYSAQVNTLKKTRKSSLEIAAVYAKQGKSLLNFAKNSKQASLGGSNQESELLRKNLLETYDNLNDQLNEAAQKGLAPNTELQAAYDLLAGKLSSVVTGFDDVVNTDNQFRQSLLQSAEIQKGVLREQAAEFLKGIAVQRTFNQTLLANTDAISASTDLANKRASIADALSGNFSGNRTGLGTSVSDPTQLNTAKVQETLKLIGDKYGPVVQEQINKAKELDKANKTFLKSIEDTGRDIVKDGLVDRSAIEKTVLDAYRSIGAESKGQKLLEDAEKEGVNSLIDFTKLISTVNADLKEESSKLLTPIEEIRKSAEERSQAERRIVTQYQKFVLDLASQKSALLTEFQNITNSLSIVPQSFEDIAAQQKQNANVFSQAGGVNIGGLSITEGSKKLKDELISITAQLKNLETSIDPADAIKSDELAGRANILRKAFDELTNTSSLLGAAQKKQQEILTRKQFAEELTFGGAQQRQQTAQTFQGVNYLARGGSAQDLSEELRSNVFSFLKRFSETNIVGGLTGQDIIDQETKRALLLSGFAPDKVDELIKASVPIEQAQLNELIAIKNSLVNQTAAQYRASGGVVYADSGDLINAPGTMFKPRGTDTVPAMLSPGEFVMRKEAVDRIGVDNLYAMNSGSIYAASGGSVDDMIESLKLSLGNRRVSPRARAAMIQRLTRLSLIRDRQQTLSRTGNVQRPRRVSARQRILQNRRSGSGNFGPSSELGQRQANQNQFPSYDPRTIQEKIKKDREEAALQKRLGGRFVSRNGQRAIFRSSAEDAMPTNYEGIPMMQRYRARQNVQKRAKDSVLDPDTITRKVFSRYSALNMNQREQVGRKSRSPYFNKGGSVYRQSGGSISSGQSGFDMSGFDKFVSSFNRSIDRLSELPRDFTMSIAPVQVTMSVVGADFMNSLQPEMQKIFTEMIQSMMPDLAKKVTQIQKGGF